MDYLYYRTWWLNQAGFWLGIALWEEDMMNTCMECAKALAKHSPSFAAQQLLSARGFGLRMQRSIENALRCERNARGEETNAELDVDEIKY